MLQSDRLLRCLTPPSPPSLPSSPSTSRLCGAVLPRTAGTTPLWIAAQNGHACVIGLLIDGLAEVNAADDEGNEFAFIIRTHFNPLLLPPSSSFSPLLPPSPSFSLLVLSQSVVSLFARRHLSLCCPTYYGPCQEPVN